MLNADDPESVLATRLLGNIIAAGTRPVVLWVGAGASRWLGYPSWKDLALQIRKTFFQRVANFDNDQAIALLNKQDYPAIFEMCRDLESAAYHKFLADSFLPRQQTGTYQAFVGLLGKISPLFIVTTNVDESLESVLPMCATVQRTDLTRCVDLLQRGIPFVAKLHGSISAVQSTVFTTSDYEALSADPSYLQPLKYIFTGCTVVFLAYGVRDGYVIRLLQENAKEMDLFGAGPHFLVTNDAAPSSTIRRIGYSLKIRPDHSAALCVLDHIIQAKAQTAHASAPISAKELSEPENATVESVPTGKTAYYISDLVPPGLFQEITARREDTEIEASFGLGFAAEEVPLGAPSALHDITVGLICFDYVYLPSSALTQAIMLLGEQLFRELVAGGVVRFIHNVSQVGVMFLPQEPIGSIASFTGRAEGGEETTPLSDVIRRSMSPVPGKEREAQELFTLIERQTVIYRRADEINVPSLIRGALLMPAVSRLLGIGDAILPAQAPRWLRYPYLRLGHLVQTGALCVEYGIQAAKVSFGGVQLTTAAFGVQPAQLYAESLASYASSGRYNSDLGALVYQDPSIVRRILRFRGQTEGESFRREIGQVLALGSGKELDVAVNAGLSRAIPTDILQRAHDKLLSLMTERARVAAVPAVWGNVRYSDSITRNWRSRSEKLLLEICQTRGIGNNDACICGSGERLRLCCLAPLRR
jgi:hypothetical protein